MALIEEGTAGRRLPAEDMASCECCPRKCGVNRPAGETGYCGIGARALVSNAGLHFGEEPPISGTRGSGTVFFAGCNLRCVFCQNHQISQEFRASGAIAESAGGLAKAMLSLQSLGAHNVNFVSPSHVVFQMAEAVEAARASGLRIPVVYNSNGYDSVEALRKIEGLVDVYLPDLKYMDGRIAERYSGAPDYPAAAAAAILEMFRQVGHLAVDGSGVAGRGLLVRHLVLPGSLDNTRMCLEFLAGLGREISISLMSQYSPRHRARDFPEISRRLSAREYDRAVGFAESLGLQNVFIQEIASQDSFLPDFDRESPFSRDC